jgi:hypothetical protein
VQDLLRLKFSLMIFNSLNSISLNIDENLEIPHSCLNLRETLHFNNEDSITHTPHLLVYFAQVRFNRRKTGVTRLSEGLVVLVKVV